MSPHRGNLYLVIFCIGGSVAVIIQILSSCSQNVTLAEALEAVVQLNEELKGAEIEGGCGKNLKLLINIFFAKRRKTVVEVIYQKKNRDHRTSKIAQKKSTPGCSSGH